MKLSKYIKGNKMECIIFILAGISICLLYFVIFKGDLEKSNDYFFPTEQLKIEYNGIFYPVNGKELEQNVKLNITQIAEGNAGILYKLELEQPPAENSMEMISGGRQYLGYYYVTKEKIYLRFAEGTDGYTTEKDQKIIEELRTDENAFIENCFVVCSGENTDSTPDEWGYVSYVEVEGKSCTFKRYGSNHDETKDDYIIQWEKGKGIVYYLYRAGNRRMEIELFQAEQ